MHNTRFLKYAAFFLLVILAISGCTAPVAAPDAADSASGSEPVELQFFYPVHVAGPLGQAVESYVADFNEEHDSTRVICISNSSVTLCH